MGAPSRRARKIRKASEFDLLRLAAELRAPRPHAPVGMWSLPEIFEARAHQLRGAFSLPARMTEAMGCDDAIFVARERRLAPSRCIPVKLTPASGTARALAIASEAEALFGQKGVGIHPDTVSDIHGCLVDHGVAFAVNVATPRPDGCRVDFEVKAWPIEWVRWDDIDRCFKTRVDPLGQRAVIPDGFLQSNAAEEPIVHGDGRWIVFKKHDLFPYRKEACLLGAAAVWARHAFAARDWAKGSTAHGNAKVMGEMPEGMPLQDSSGGLTKEAAAFLELLRMVAAAESPFGIRPAGAKTDYLTNSSNAWQVWKELVENAEKAAARVYLGTDGTLGTNSGAPGVDALALFGVEETKIIGDLRCIERGLATGTIEPWCATNHGDSSLAPHRTYQIPDGEEEARQKARGERTAAFTKALSDLRTAGVVVDQDYINGLAADFNVRAPKLTAAILPPVPPTAAG